MTSTPEQIRSGDQLALSRAISAFEDGDGAPLLLKAAASASGHALRIGVTGAPGVGKSSLIGELVRCWASRERKIAVLAVDPSSERSGGAVLGDRVRLPAGTGSCFFRSMGSRGSHGALAHATCVAADLLDLAGYDLVLIETVGAGQTQIAVSALVDCVGVVLSPESGDSIQTIKAGLMEWADLFIVNKMDRPGGDRIAGELADMPGDDTPRAVCKTSAVSGDGVDQCIDLIDRWLEDARASGELKDRRSRQRLARVRMLIEAGLAEKMQEDWVAQIAASVERVDGDGLSVYDAAHRFLDCIQLTDYE